MFTAFDRIYPFRENLVQKNENCQSEICWNFAELCKYEFIMNYYEFTIQIWEYYELLKSAECDDDFSFSVLDLKYPF